MQKIEAGSFEDLLKSLTNIHLQENDFNVLDLGIFASTRNIRKLYLDHNELLEFTSDTAIDFSDDLRGLYLRYNEIQNLKAGMIANYSEDNLFGWVSKFGTTKCRTANIKITKYQLFDRFFNEFISFIFS